MGSSRWPRSTRTASWTSARAAEVAEGVQRGPDGAAGVEDVVDQDDGAAFDAAGRELGALERAGRVQAQVVAVHRDVE